ncbi:Flp pilus assembly complex ATPase component TadA, partial [bacterium]|nr:Flp pilus assembly complex ATPase component TadA [bacterium]
MAPSQSEVQAPVTEGAAREIADILIQAGDIDDQQLEYALRIKSKLANPRPLTTILEELGMVTQEQLRKTLTTNRVKLRLGALLLELGEISESDLRAAVALQKESGDRKLGEILVENHFIAEDDLLQVLSAQLGFPYLEAERLQVDRSITGRFRPEWFVQNGCFILRGEDGSLLLAAKDPLNNRPQLEAEKILNRALTPCLAKRHVIDQAIRAIQGGPSAGRAAVDVESELVKTVESILIEAIAHNASDIHVEPMKNRLRIRFREDGVLVPQKDLPLEMARGLASRIKILAGADIAERRRHQDGRLLFEHEGLNIDMRVSFYSTIHGEKIVMRLLNNRSNLLDIKDIGMAPKMGERFRTDVLDVPSGVTLVTGPTGSGKTTTLYGAINYLNNTNTSIITAEDPVEYVINGINQCSINPKIN